MLAADPVLVYHTMTSVEHSDTFSLQCSWRLTFLFFICVQVLLTRLALELSGWRFHPCPKRGIRCLFRRQTRGDNSTRSYVTS